MKNILLDLALIIDLYPLDNSEKAPESASVYQALIQSDDYQVYITSASLLELESKQIERLMQVSPLLTIEKIREKTQVFFKNLCTEIKIAKTPAYIDLEIGDIKIAQMLAAVQAINGKILTKNPRYLEQYPNDFISIDTCLNAIEQAPISIDFANLKKQYWALQPQIERQIDEVLSNTAFVMGQKVTELEQTLCDFTNANHVISCSSGTDALLLAMMAMDVEPDDEIITTPFTFIATAETIALMKAKPVFVDVDPVSYNLNPDLIEAAITDKTKIIMPVSLYGQPAEMDKINAIAQKHNLKVIIDGAQSFGATYKGKQEVHHCDIYTTSFFPAKPLGAYGDGGAVLTQNDGYAKKIAMLREHGQRKRYHHDYIGMGGRLDALQAAILLAKFPTYASEIKQRQAVAKAYTLALSKQFKTPDIASDCQSVWAQYTLRVPNRAAIQAHLQKQGIPTAIHYPMPLHLQACFQYLNFSEGAFPVAELLSKEVISLPMNPFITPKQIDYIVLTLKEMLTR